MDAATIRKIISYNPQTGEIKRLDRKNGNGSIDHYGYLVIKIKGKQYKAHRLAWLHYYGTEPKYNIDHINGVKTDNRIFNLRDVPQLINVHNTYVPPNKDTGVRGIHLSHNTNKKYTIKLYGKTYRFYTIEEAITFKQENFNYYGQANHIS